MMEFFAWFADASLLQQTSVVVLWIWSQLVVFYTLYLAAVNVWENRQSVHWSVLLFASPILLTMVFMDFFMNMTFFTVFMWDWPHECFVTQRMKRYRKMATENWRKSFAVALCTKLLNPFDPTRDHC